MKKQNYLRPGFAGALLLAGLLGVTGPGAGAQEGATSIPSRYDGREHGYLTPVRNQERSNMCWAYATIACLKADAVKNHQFGTDLDLSEHHLAYHTFSEKKDPLGLTNSDTVSFHNLSAQSNFIANGANLSYAVSTLTGGMGPVLESNVPTAKLFNERGEVLPDAYTWKIDEALRRDKNVLEIENVYVYSLLGKDQHNLIKRGIMEHGAAAASYYSQNKNAYYTTAAHETAYYQTDKKKDPDHGIAIVGWDDDYPVTDFKPGTQPKKPGAWLVKNSWGHADHFTTKGYFWLSYEDESFLHKTSEGKNPCAYVYDVQRAGSYRHNYQYDGGIIHEYSETVTEQQATAPRQYFYGAGQSDSGSDRHTDGPWLCQCSV